MTHNRVLPRLKNSSDSVLRKQIVLYRFDGNVPIENNTVADDYRLLQIIPTLKKLRSLSAITIAVTHIGRPTQPWTKEFSTRVVGERLAHLLKLKFSAITKQRFPADTIPQLFWISGDALKWLEKSHLVQLPAGSIVLLENLRFWPGEEENHEKFAKKLAALASVYLNDGFAVSHRKSASTVAITKLLPSYAGPLLLREVRELSRFYGMQIPQPFTLILGGIKLEDKIGMLLHLAPQAKNIIVGGGIANMLLVAAGYAVGSSVIDTQGMKHARTIWRNYREKIILPVDLIVGDPESGAHYEHIPVSSVQKHQAIYDVGPETIQLITPYIKKSKTVVWNGPLGWFEKKPFSHGTKALATLVGSVAQGKTYAVVGGGETVDAIRMMHQADHIDHVSTGGGAMLQFLENPQLPGIMALTHT